MNDRENTLSLSWCDRTWLNILNPQNVLNYFAERSNPFYDHTCNNEMLRMRGIRMDLIQELEKMQGIEYVLLHVQEPILYVIRKQKRHSPTATTPIANYYIIAGVVYQAPDLQSIIQSKMLTAIHYLQSAFDECFKYARFHPSTDYYWNFSNDGASSSPGAAGSADDKESATSKSSRKEEKKKETVETTEQSRQMYRVDVLMHELVRKFPPKIPGANPAITDQQSGTAENVENSNPNVNGVKSENTTNAQTATGESNMETGPDDDKAKTNPTQNQMTPPAKKPKLA